MEKDIVLDAYSWPEGKEKRTLMGIIAISLIESLHYAEQ